jgi:hypothetical protein
LELVREGRSVFARFHEATDGIEATPTHGLHEVSDGFTSAGLGYYDEKVQLGNSCLESLASTGDRLDVVRTCRPSVGAFKG